MFTLMNLYNNDTIKIRVKYKEEYLDFYLGGIINKKNTGDIIQNNSFYLLNKYLDFKGEEVKENIFNILKHANNVIYEEQQKEYLDEVPSHIIERLLETSPIEDVLDFVKKYGNINIPISLKHEFDKNIEYSGKGSREQTYIIEDYYNLVALSIVIKLTIAPIGHYAFIMKDKINSNMICYMLIHFYRDYEIFQSAPIVKLRVMIQKLLDKNSDEAYNTEIIKYNIPKEELDIYILSLVLIQKIALATFDEHDNTNIINNIYNYIKNKTNVETDTCNSIKNKTPLIDSDSNDKESVIESYRLTTNIPQGFILEINWSVSTLEMIFKQLPITIKKYIDNDLVNVAINSSNELRSIVIKQPQLDIISHIFKSIIDPRAIPYLTIDNLLNLFHVGFSYLYKIGFYELAILIMSKPMDICNDIYIPTTNRTKIEKELKDELEYYYPYKEIVNNEKQKNVMEEHIENICKEIVAINWIPLVSDEYLNVLKGYNIQEKIIPNNIKNILANFYITTEKLLIGEK